MGVSGDILLAVFFQSLFLCLVMEGVILIGISQAGSFALVVVLFGILTIFGGVGNTLLDTSAMETIPSKLHGVYFGLSVTIANTCLGFSMFIAGILLDIFTPRGMGLVGGMLYVVVGLLFFIFSLRIKLSKERKNLLNKEVG